MQPFRSDIDALEARHASLEAEVAERTRARDEAAQMLAEARMRERNTEIAADFASGGPARRRRRAVTIVLTVFAFGIGVASFARYKYDRRNERDVAMARVMAQFEAFADEACTCVDSACVTKVSEKMTTWAQQVAKQAPADQKPNEKWMKKATALGERLTTCMTKAMTQSPYASQEQGVNARAELER